MRTVTIFIAIIPQDYTYAEVEVFETHREAKDFIQENCIRGDSQYCFAIERKVVCE